MLPEIYNIFLLILRLISNGRTSTPRNVDIKEQTLGVVAKVAIDAVGVVAY